MPEFRLPGDLTKLSKAELAELKAQAKAELDSIVQRDTKEKPHTMEDAVRTKELADAISAVAAADAQIDADAAEIASQMDAARAQVDEVFASHPDGAEEAEETPVEEVAEPELVTAAASKPKAKTEPVLKKPTLNASLRTASLREAAAEAAKTQGIVPVYGNAADLIVTASANIPDFDKGTKFDSVISLADAFSANARTLPTTNGHPYYSKVASFADERVAGMTALSDRTPLPQVEEILKKAASVDRLWETVNDGQGITVAGGGWCAPSVNRYAFFNVACEDGGIDLPTIAIERGGINFPTSPSLASVFTGEFTSGTNPWLWTETDDIATVTGSPNKPCVRVPCPSFTNVRLECYGICLTAGNLIDNAYPEAVAHQISLLQSALFHASNTRYIQQMVGLSETVVTGGAGGAGVISPVLYMVELAAEDYRTRFGMCQTDVLEVVLPHWIIPAMRADATKRTGVDLIGVTDNMIADWFDLRHIRAQFVSDWQVRTTALLPGGTASGGMNSWPTSVDFLIFAAGTFVRGNGMNLNLGVVRDSVLNAENDHTALWMEECHLIARFGFQSRQYRVNICADGTTGAADLTSCLP